MGKKEEPYGVRVTYLKGGSETRWFSTETERDRYYSLLHQSKQFAVKEIKKKKR